MYDLIRLITKIAEAVNVNRFDQNFTELGRIRWNHMLYFIQITLFNYYRFDSIKVTYESYCMQKVCK